LQKGTVLWRKQATTQADGLPLAVLARLASLSQPILLPFLHPGIPGEQTEAAKLRLKAFVHFNQGTAYTMADCPRLTHSATSSYLYDGTEFI
jgi:hypothetical protein